MHGGQQHRKINGILPDVPYRVAILRIVRSQHFHVDQIVLTETLETSWKLRRDAVPPDQSSGSDA